ncbi:DUF1656 domain-containing protein [Azospirillum sp. ST 5-10]|uniref:DUF1656 domain-containing protein n=1 Tax=unclassified Azospirillum TaxID=2630922 RepID=UPI003F4A2C9F
MIVDLNIGGVFIPGLVVLAFIALIATMATMRFFAATGISRLFAYRPLVEIATFLFIYGLLVQHLPRIGLLS